MELVKDILHMLIGKKFRYIFIDQLSTYSKTYTFYLTLTRILVDICTDLKNIINF
jgi:hypothetical protein